MSEQVLFSNYNPDRPATLDEYRSSGGYEALSDAVLRGSPRDVLEKIKASGLRGRGGAGVPTSIKWSGVPDKAPFPRYVISNTDEMEPGTFKDRVLVNADPHMVIEGLLIAGYAISAQRGIFFVRPSYEMDAELIERELVTAREAGYLGEHILGSDFSFDLSVHRSAGRYICGEATAQVNAIQGTRPQPSKGGPHMTEEGLWKRPTLVNNVETLACVPHILRNGPQWFKGLAATDNGAGTKLYSVSGMVERPGCYELPIGTRLGQIIEASAGGMRGRAEFKACLPGGASTGFITKSLWDIEMDFDPLKKAGQRLGTGAVIVFDQETCLVATTLNLMEFFVRESCGFCTPCREGLPFVRDLLKRIEIGEGEERYVPLLRQMTQYMNHAYCAFAPGAVAPLKALLDSFQDEIMEHISGKGCPFKTSGHSASEKRE